MAEQAIVVLNAGSSSVKFSVFFKESGNLGLRIRGQIEALFSEPRFTAKDAAGAKVSEKSWPAGTKLGHDGALAQLFEFLRGRADGVKLIGVGHRVVHGGMEYTHPVRVDATVLAALDKFVPLAPLHQPHNLAAIRAVLHRSPDVPQVACFDTAFHRTNPEIAQMFALPYELHEARRTALRLPWAELRIHRLGAAGARCECRAGPHRRAAPGQRRQHVCAQGGTSVASTMGFTAVDGLPMGTRTGNLDPGVVLYLMDERGMDARAIEKLLYQQSGLLGVSGIASDMRTLLASPEPRAKLAVDLFVYRIGRELGSLAAALGGLDAIVFTAGVGENSAKIRARICQAAAWLGVELDASANTAGGPRISTRGESSRSLDDSDQRRTDDRAPH